MIVADTNIICYLLLSGEHSAEAHHALEKDPLWVVPYLWRSEFCNVMTAYVRRKHLSLQDAQNNLEHALLLFQGKEYFLSPHRVLELAVNTTCSAYDCEFVALAREMRVKLVTLDHQILAQFPETAVPLDKFLLS